jgi:prephenate dehydratase
VKVAHQSGRGESVIAASRLFPNDERVALATAGEVYASLERGTAAAAVLPVETTRSGAVVDVYDLLRTHTDTRVIAETIVPVAGDGEPHYERFFAIARADDARAAERLDPRTGNGTIKTSLVYTTRNVPGALIHSLQPFAVAKIQLTKIESRPSRSAAWEYVFYLDFEGDPATQHVADALEVMRASCAWVHVLGTYRAAAHPEAVHA